MATEKKWNAYLQTTHERLDEIRADKTAVGALVAMKVTMKAYIEAMWMLREQHTEEFLEMVKEAAKATKKKSAADKIAELEAKLEALQALTEAEAAPEEEVK